MRYCPKEKKWKDNITIGIDTLGHAKFYEELFAATMKLTNTEFTFSGLRRMWQKKEYGRI
jgi:hypothetical protein